MADKGVMYVKDIIQENGKALNYLAFLQKFNITQCHFTTYWGLVSAIPRDWKTYDDPDNISANKGEGLLRR